ncbi:hypothetical protein KKF86_05420 [bacterium]|nr:hypothetical protein [bacterium]
MDQKEIDLEAIGKIIWKWKTKIVLFVFIVTSLSIGISLLLPKWYKAQAVVLSPGSSDTAISPMTNILGNLGLGGVMGGDGNVFRYLAIIKSRSLRESVIRKFNLVQHYKSKNEELALEKLDKYIYFEVGDENQVVISIIDKDQDLVADITNYMIYCLDSLNIELSVSNARNNRIFMETRVNSIMDSLEFISQNLADFMKSKGILSLGDQVTAGVEQAAFMKSAIIQKEVELEVAQKSFGTNNPTVNLLKFELQSLKSKYKEFTSQNSVESLMPNFSEVPNLQLKLLKMQRQIEYYTRLIEYLGPMYEQQKFEEAKNIPTLQVLDKAIRPELKAKPKRATIVILVFLLSSIFAVTYAIIKESVYQK